MSDVMKRIVGVGVVLLICTYAVAALRGPGGWTALSEKRRQIRELQEQNATIARDIQLKRERIERLKTNRNEQELEIRKQLKLLRPGETLFILPEQPKNHPVPDSPSK